MILMIHLRFRKLLRTNLKSDFKCFWDVLMMVVQFMFYGSGLKTRAFELNTLGTA